MRTLNCITCGDSFKTNHSQAKYCSDDCSRVGMRASWNKYGEKNKVARRAYQKALYKKNSKIVAARVMAYHKTENGKKARRVADANQKANNPERVLARQIVSQAKRDGKLLKQPCEICGSKTVHAHHDDYAKPLDVRWLCPQHHSEHHMQKREQPNE